MYLAEEQKHGALDWSERAYEERRARYVTPERRHIEQIDCLRNYFLDVFEPPA